MHIILAGVFVAGVVLLHWVVKGFYESEDKPVHRNMRKYPWPFGVEVLSGASCQCVMKKEGGCRDLFIEVYAPHTQ
jgi:hypothetical protein